MINLIAKWKTIQEEKAAELIIFNAFYKTKLHPKTGKQAKFTVIDSPDWVNIIPVTTEGKIVLVQQYRHGTDEITLELPGGLIESGELPEVAAKRECIEETGFASELIPIKIGSQKPNPAFLTNTCLTFLWENCRLKYEQNLDTNEDIAVLEYTIEQIRELIKIGRIDHGVILTAFFFYFMHKENL